VLDLEPGQMLSWPLNAIALKSRGLSIFHDGVVCDSNQRTDIVNLANGLPPPLAISRRAASCAVRRSSRRCAKAAARRRRGQRGAARAMIDFRLDAARQDRRSAEGGVNGPVAAVLTAAGGKPGARSIAHQERVEFASAETGRVALGDVGPSTPFRTASGSMHYRAFAGLDDVEPLIAVVSDAVTGERAALLPLVRRLQKGIRIVEFADLDLTDYNAPLLGPAAPRDARAARAMWRDLKTALRRMPGGADLIRLRKMPLDLAGRPNPLALLDGAGPCSLNGNIVTTGEDYNAWRFTLGRTVRKELERSWRVFTRDPAAIQDRHRQDDALQILAVTEAQQGARMQQLRLNFILNNRPAPFYRNLVNDGIGSGFAVVSALTSGDEVVATLLGVLAFAT
jgi:hypothetical protein